MVSKSWCFTWNNYDDMAILALTTNPSFSFLAFGKEVGATGTPHLQGVIVFPIAHRLSKLKKVFGKHPHWEPCRNLAASIVYCKKDGDFVEIDRRKKRGPKKKEQPKPERKPLNPCYAVPQSLLPSFDFSTIL